jgi:FixJ family two-component response regulator
MHDINNPVPTIHLVDDDPSTLRALSRALRSAGYSIEKFGSAEEFLAFRGSSPDAPGCAIVDLKLPGLSGLELQDRLKQQNDLLTIIFLTGYGDVPTSVQAMKHDAVDFLMKPVCLDDLLVAVQRAFKTNAAAREAWHQKQAIVTRYEKLTPREREVMALVVRGLINKQIAYKLGIVERTIKAHRAQIMAKMQVNSIAELVRLAGYLDEAAIGKGESV